MPCLTHTETMDDGAAIRLCWADGGKTCYHAIWLRDNALDEASRSSPNGQRLISVQSVPVAIRITAAGCTDTELTIRVEPETKTLRFPADWLYGNAYDRPHKGQWGRCASWVDTWHSSFDADRVTSDYSAVSKDPVVRRLWLSQVQRYGFARLTGGPVRSGALLDVAGLFGYVRETNYGRWFEVRTEVNPANFAYTGLGLQAHTDNPYRGPVAALQILYCLDNSTAGGDNCVVDGFRAARRLREETPEHLSLLARYRARFEYLGIGDVCLNAHRPMIELSPEGELTGIRCNNRCTAPINGVPFDVMQDYCAAYRHFARIIDDPDRARAVVFRLTPGYCFIVDNTRVLHGRTAYAASSGSRWLQGCYADIDGLHSTLAVLEQRHTDDREATV